MTLTFNSDRSAGGTPLKIRVVGLNVNHDGKPRPSTGRFLVTSENDFSLGQQYISSAM